MRKNGVRIKLQEQPFRVLLELVANAGKVVGREELQQKLWSADTFVDFDVGLNTAIRKLRQALGDDSDNPHYIETLARRGYRFVAPVSVVSAAALSDVAPTPAAGQDEEQRDYDHAIQLRSEPGGESVPVSAPKTRSWYWVLAASVAVALLVYGAIVAWRGKDTTPALAIEQRITANPAEAPITAAVISPDGKYVAYSDSTGVYIRHIDSGETRPLQLPKDFNAVPTSWFPDGTHLLLSTGEALYGSWSLGPRGNGSLWKVSLLGGNPQKLIDNASGGVVSPDGSQIAFLRGEVGNSREIWVMRTDGSNPARVVDASAPEDSLAAGKGTTQPAGN